MVSIDKQSKLNLCSPMYKKDKQLSDKLYLRKYV